MFDERYHTTVGVKVDMKIVKVDGADVSLAIWDLEGVDDFQPLKNIPPPRFERMPAGRRRHA